jgi:hypothetical protein
MKKLAMIIIVLLAAPKLHAAKVCVSEAQFKAIYESAYPRKHYCSTSISTPLSGNNTGRYCWCFVSNSWSYSGDDYQNYGLYCPDYCAESCNLSYPY